MRRFVRKANILLGALITALMISGLDVYAARDCGYRRLAGNTIIEQRINELRDSFVGAYFTVNQGKDTCANNVCDNCQLSNILQQQWMYNKIGCNPSIKQMPSGDAWTCRGFASFALWYLFRDSNGSSVSRVQVNSTAVNSFASIKSLAKMGDYISTSGHAYIFVEFASDGDMIVIDSNGLEGYNEVNYRKVKSSNTLYTTNAKIFRASNYDSKSNPTNPSTPSSSTWYQVTNPGGLNLNSQANFTSGILTMPQGAIVEYLETVSSSIYKVKYYNQVGYMASTTKYIQQCSEPDMRPICYLDEISGGKGEVNIAGWAFDRDDYDEEIQMIIQIDNSLYYRRANKYKSIKSVYPGLSDYHGFNETIKTDKTGNVRVNIYAQNIGRGSGNILLYSGEVYVEAEKKPISFKSVTRKNIDLKNGTCDIVATIYSEGGVEKVAFPTWTLANGQDDLIGDWASNSKTIGSTRSLGNNLYESTYTVRISDHNYERGDYRTDVYAYSSSNYCAYGTVYNMDRAVIEDPNSNGLTLGTDGVWYLVSNGTILTDYNDLYYDAKYGWWKIKNGKLDLGYTDLYYSPTYGWWKVTGGQLDTAYTDLYCSPTMGWWKVYGGAVDLNYTDLYYSPTVGWWKVKGGALDLTYTDLYCSPTYGWWKVNGGQLDVGYTDIYYSPTLGWWKVYGGALDIVYTDLYNSPTYGWWKVKGGQLDLGFTDFYFSPTYGWWKVDSGHLDLGYTDFYYSPTIGWWKVNNGQIDLGYNGLYFSQTLGWRKVAGGTVDWTYTGVYNDPAIGAWFVYAGQIDFNYNGYYNTGGVIYYITNGRAVPVGYGSNIEEGVVPEFEPVDMEPQDIEDTNPVVMENEDDGDEKPIIPNNDNPDTKEVIESAEIRSVV